MAMERTAQNETRKSAEEGDVGKNHHGDGELPFPPVVVYERWCKGCGICVEFCPRDVLELGEDEHAKVARPEQCNRCALCEVHCPDFAIRLVRTGEKEIHHYHQ